MATAGLDRALLMPRVPQLAQPIWEDHVRTIGPERVLRGIEARNPNPQDTFSWPEKRVRDALNYCGVSFNRRPFVLPLYNEVTDKFFTYRPDYELRKIKRNGRDVLLDPHSASLITPEFVDKLKRVRRFYGCLYYLVLIWDTYPEVVDSKLAAVGERHTALADESWFLMNKPPEDGQYHYKFLNMKSPPKEVIQLLRRKIRDLARQDSGEMSLIAPVGIQ